MLFFLFVVFWLIVQRLLELRTANRNTTRLLKAGGIEVGRSHYPLIVILHVCFFASLIIEFVVRRPAAFPSYWWLAFIVFILAQLLRFWVRSTMKARWTTRIIVVPGEQLVDRGPYRYLPHPNYLAVSLELLSVPLIFGLYCTAIIFTVANAAILLLIRIPMEAQALRQSQT
jgi:methyltransferase